jgi:hypothetical protein
VTEALAPTFLLIGAGKAGTTALFHALAGHPDVFTSPVKEPAHFLTLSPVASAETRRNHVSGWEEYLALFDGAQPNQARGEATVGYLHAAGVPTRVRQRLPDVRLVVILRHPVETTWSRYWMARRHEGLRRSLDHLIDRESLDPRSDLPYDGWTDIMVRSSFYAAHLQRWVDAFGEAPLLAVTHDDLTRDAPSVLRAVFEHLAVDPDVPVDGSRRLNEGSKPRSARLQQLVRRPSPRTLAVVRATVPHRVRSWARVTAIRTNEQPIPPMPPATRRRLLDIYREDTLALEALLGRDLSAWRR